MRLVGLEKIARWRVAQLRGPADESDALAVEGPDRIGVGIDTRGEEPDGFCGRIVDADEAVIATRGRKYELRAIGGPLLGMILAADNQVIGLTAGVKGREIDLAVAHVSDGAFGGNFGRIAGVYFFGLAAAPGNAPDGLFGSSRIADRIGELPGGILAFATDIRDGVAVVRETHRGNGLAVIFEIGSEPARLEGRSFSDPDIALAFLVEGPGDAIDGFGRGQVFGKRRAH